MMKKSLGLLAVASCMGAMGVANAADCLLRVGVHSVNPKSNNNPIVHVDDGASLSINGSCFVTPNVAIDVLGALPFSHDIKLNSNNAKVGSTKHLPPTIGVQYHFAPGGKFNPYVGAGVNYTFFFNRSTTGALAGTRLDLGSSFGLAAQVGGDFNLANNWVLGLDVRYAKISTAAKVNGGSIGDVNIDPIVYGVTIGKKFSL
jgi:outer membrane protein